MDQQVSLAASASRFRDQLQGRVRDYGLQPDGVYLSPVLEVGRDRRLVAAVVAATQGRDEVLDTFAYAVRAFGASDVAVGVDTRAAGDVPALASHFGRAYEHGDVARAVRDGVDAAVADALLVGFVSRSAATLLTQIYTPHDDLSVTWMDARELASEVAAASPWTSELSDALSGAAEFRAALERGRPGSRRERALAADAEVVTRLRAGGSLVVYLPSSRSDAAWFDANVPGGLTERGPGGAASRN